MEWDAYILTNCKEPDDNLSCFVEYYFRSCWCLWCARTWYKSVPYRFSAKLFCLCSTITIWLPWDTGSVLPGQLVARFLRCLPDSVHSQLPYMEPGTPMSTTIHTMPTHWNTYQTSCYEFMMLAQLLASISAEVKRISAVPVSPSWLGGR